VFGGFQTDGIYDETYFESVEAWHWRSKRFFDGHSYCDWKV